MLDLSVLTTAWGWVLRLPSRPAEAAPRLADPVPRASSTEGLFVAQLLRGELTRAQYREAMACFAARNDAHQPIRLPADGTGDPAD